MHPLRRSIRAAALASLTLSAPAFSQQVDATWMPAGVGDWHDPFRWSGLVVPDNNGGSGNTFGVFIDGGDMPASFISHNAPTTTIDNLSISSGDTLMNNGGQLRLVGNGAVSTLHNAGFLDTTGMLSLEATGNTINGGGTIRLQSPPAYLGGMTPGSRVTNVDNIIEGQGMIGGNITALTNQSVIRANMPGATLVIDPADVANACVNTDTLLATNGGVLVLSGAGNGSFINTGGLIRADASSTVRFDAGAIIKGGEITTTGDGVLLVPSNGTLPITFEDVKNSGRLDMAADVTFAGTINNTGSINFTQICFAAVGNGAASLTGGGTVNMIGLIGGPGVLTNVNNHIRGAGLIGFNNLTFVNQPAGLVEADMPEASMQINGMPSSTFFNSGIARAVNGGTLELTNGSVINSGTIAALDGSFVQLRNNVNISGGTLATEGGGLIQIGPGPAAQATLSNLTVAGYLNHNNGTLHLSGTINNRGVMNSYSRVNLTGGAVTLDGNGYLYLQNQSLSRILGTGTLINAAAHTIGGRGDIGSFGSIAVSNSGSIIASGGGLNVGAPYITNTGDLRADYNAFLGLYTTNFTGTSGTITPDGTVVLSGQQFSAGTIAGAGTLQVDGPGNVTAKHVRVGRLSIFGSSTLTINANGTDTGVSRLMSNPVFFENGRFDLNDNDLLVSNGTVSTIVTQVAAARNGGAWNGSGITSSAARTHPHGATTLGVLSGADYISASGSSTFGGLSVAPSDALVKYTWYGDSDFNGEVNFDDYVRIDGGYNFGLTGWINGDFDLSGGVDFDDYVLIDLGFNSQNGTLRRAQAYLSGDDRSLRDMNDPALRMVIEHFDRFGADYASGFVAAVPEPGTLVGLSTVAGLLARRRR